MSRGRTAKQKGFNRTLATEWAYRQVFATKSERSTALPDFLHNYNQLWAPPHGPRTSTTHYSPVTKLTAEYT